MTDKKDCFTGSLSNFEMIRLIVGMIVVLSIVISCDSSRAAWLVNTYRDGSTVNNLAAALNLINTTLPIASGNLALGDMLATHSGIYDTKNARI